MTTRYTQDHEWLKSEADGTVTVGITAYAQEQLGDIVFVQLPEVGASLAKGDEAAVIESVKTAGEINMAVSGTVTEVNSALADEPAKVNEDPEGEGWFFKLKGVNRDEFARLMDAGAYKTFVDGL